jgi:hypothetical protein
MSVDETSARTTSQSRLRARLPRGETPYRVAVVVILVAVAALLTAAYLASDTDTGDDVARSGGSSEFVDRLTPGRDEEVLSQASVEIDLAAGWTGFFVIDGQEVRTESDGLVTRPELAQLGFTPGEGKVLDEWPSGVNCVTARVWRQADGEASARNVSWCFDVL